MKWEKLNKGKKMSLKTWKKEFYPVPASKVSGKKTAIKHSLKKWQGLTEENLKKHGLIFTYDFDDASIRETMVSSNLPGCSFGINSKTCALCQLYYNNDGSDTDDKSDCCYKCPLYQSLGHRCDGRSDRPYVVFLDSGDPVPMIKALEKMLKN